ncbi:MAG: hypothetical protein ACREEL_09350 [Stellaceae bacterium]
MARKAAKKSAKQREKQLRRKRSKEAWFGLVIDGNRTPFSLPSVEEAAAAAAGLREQGHAVAIYDQDTNRIVRRL